MRQRFEQISACVLLARRNGIKGAMPRICSIGAAWASP
jgi:hypothetical protein